MKGAELVVPDNFEGLTEQEKKLAMQMLEEFSKTGDSKTFEEIKYQDYEEIPVDIETFLHDRRYLGNGLYDSSGRFTIYPYWEKTLKDIFPDNITTKYNTLILTGAIGLGKAQPLDSPVLTPNGFKRMGDIHVGDRVFGRDGKLHNVIGVFPQGEKDVYRVTFTDKSSTLCCKEHLWEVIDKGDKYRSKRFNVARRVKDVEWLLSKQLYKKRKQGEGVEHRYSIPMCEPVEFEHKEVFIHPYILGCLIGDGCLGQSTQLTTADEDIIKNVQNHLDEAYELNYLYRPYSYSIKQKNKTMHNKYTDEIRRMGLNVKSPEKFIPKEYLYNDVESRVALLQGLLDTDGTITSSGRITFSTTSEKLKNDITFLVESLGGISYSCTRYPHYTNPKGERVQCRDSYDITICLPKKIVPFRLERKLKRVKLESLSPRRYFHSIELEGKQQCQCIMLDGEEHLYLTDHCIVTHNTQIACVCLLYILYRLLCLKDPYLFYGLQPIDKISISLMNITLENAKGVALDKINQMILSSEWFMSHGEMRGTTNLEYVPEKHIELITASSNNQVVGRCLFCLDGNTVIATSDGDKKLKDIVDKPIKVLTLGDNNELTLSNTCFVKPTLVSNEEIDIELENGSHIKCTPNHLLKLKDGSYKEAGLLTEIDELYDIQSDLTYDSFIENIIKTRGQWNIPDNEYFEVHHIKPVCLGGEPSRKALTKKVKYSKHPNLIWLYPQEHYIAHKLLFEKYPEEYGLHAALVGTTANFTISAEEFASIKDYKHYLPENITAKIPDTPFHYKPRKIAKRKTDRDVSKYIAYQARKREAGICETRGKNNGMYGKGHLVSGGRNGHASIRYFYKDLVFESRKELLEYLQSIDVKITSSAIRAVVHNTATLRVYNMYKEVFDNLRWEYKE